MSPDREVRRQDTRTGNLVFLSQRDLIVQAQCASRSGFIGGVHDRYFDQAGRWQRLVRPLQQWVDHAFQQVTPQVAVDPQRDVQGRGGLGAGRVRRARPVGPFL